MAKHEKPPVFDIEDDAVLVINNAKDFDPQKVGLALTATALKHGGKLVAEDALEEARDPRHVLHRHLEWNDGKAAHQHRLAQMRSIIRIVRIEVGTPPEMRRAFINAPADDGRAYRTLADVLGSGDLRDLILQQAERDLAAWRHRYNELREICELVDVALVELRKRKRGKTTPGADEKPPA